jgi:hypothetical protein
LQTDFVALWDQTGPKRLSPEEEQRQYHGRVVFTDHADECLAAQVVGSGIAGPVPVLARLRIQSDVVKRVRRAIEEPPSIKPTGGLLGSVQIDGRRTTLIAVVEPNAEAQARFREFLTQHVSPILAPHGGAGRVGLQPGPSQVWRSPYQLPDRSGTITLALLPPSGDKQTLDSLIPPGDVLGRSLLTGKREGEALLIAIVEEQRR